MCSNLPDREEHLRQLDIKLRQMIQEARSYPDRSSKRRKLVYHMIQEILYSGEIKTEGDDIYQDALSATMEWFGRNWHNFDSARARNPEGATVIGWFKHILYRYKIRDAKREAEKSQNMEVKQGEFTIKIRFTSETVGKDGEKKNVLDDIADPTENPQKEIELRECVTAMRNCIQQCRVLRNIRVPDHPEIDCQRLLLNLLPEWRKDKGWTEGRSLEELEQEFGVHKRKLQDCYKKFLKSQSIQQLQNCLAQWR